MNFLSVVGLLWAVEIASAYSSALTVNTNTGIYTGIRNADYPNVREFRNIPYAQPPVGDLRWMPPAALPKSTQRYNSSQYPPSCPQYVSSIPSVWNWYVPYLMIENGNPNHATGMTAVASSEDCLSLAVWTPYNVSSDANLPVIFFMTGGSFLTGGVNFAGQIPLQWVNRTQEHIVVTINYRVNIFGFPTAAALDQQNLGILDQRMALEWVHTNIDNFGGDPERITMWGQSAGGRSADVHNYAFWDDPIVQGTFMQSGNVERGFTNADYQHTNFTFVAKNLGCDFPDDAEAELDCMRQVPMVDIENFVGEYSDNGTTPELDFTALPDDVVIFRNYSARAAAGYISPKPAISSNCANEMASLVDFPLNNYTFGPDPATLLASDINSFICGTSNQSNTRHAAGLITYRYQYAGVWRNQDPLDWLGSYHSSDIVMNFGTYHINATNTTGGPTTEEAATSAIMQDHILAFMKDPVNGPPSLGWYPYVYGGNVIRFGAGGVPAQNVSGYEIDGVCYGNGTYDNYPQ